MDDDVVVRSKFEIRMFTNTSGGVTIEQDVFGGGESAIAIAIDLEDIGRIVSALKRLERDLLAEQGVSVSSSNAKPNP